MTLDEIRERLCIAMRVPRDTPDWLERAERQLFAHRNWLEHIAPKPLDLSVLGNRVRYARECAGMTQAQLAARIGVRKYNIWGWEHGTQDIPGEKFPGLCMSLGVGQAWMLGESESGGPKVPEAVLRTSLSPNYAAYRRSRLMARVDREKNARALAQIQAEVEALKKRAK